MDLYHNNMAACSQKVRLVLREKNLRPVEHHLNLRAGDAQHPDYLALNPNGVVPTLVDHGRAVIESTIICEYLDDAYPDIPLRPADPLERAEMRLWTMLPDTGLHQACGVISGAIAFRHQTLALPKDQIERQIAAKPDPKIREFLRMLLEQGPEAPIFAPNIQTYDTILGKMESALSGRTWLGGDHYSLADTAILPYVQRIDHLYLKDIFLAHRPAVLDWYERGSARANYVGISEYLDETYLPLMAEKGAEARKTVEAIINA
jgi:glutathione S-transferase